MIGGIIFIVFLILKLTGTIQWSWWWVTAPLWIGVVLEVIIRSVMAVSFFGILGGAWAWSKVKRASKRKIGGWILFGVGIWFMIGAITIGIIDLIDNMLSLKTALEIGITAGPASVALWGGWKLAHPKPKLIY